MEKFIYPEARRDEEFSEIYHGVEIKDPYRWLEDPESEETKQFVAAQNAVTRPYLDACPEKQDIYDRIKQMWDVPKSYCPRRHGDKYYFYRNTGLQNQSVLFVQDTLDSEPEMFFDPNSLSEDGSVAVSSKEFSKNGRILAYGLSSSGSDWSTIHFMDTETRKKYPEVLEKIKYSPITWTNDNLGIFYGTYIDQKGVTDGSETVGARDQKLCYHRIGTPQSEDVIVVEFPEEPLWRIGAIVSNCGKWLIITPRKDCRDNLVYFTSLEDNKLDGKLPLKKIVDKFEADYEFITTEGTSAIFRTNKNAPNYQLISIDLNDYASDKWTTLLPEHPEYVLDWAAAVDGDKFVACYIEDVKHVLKLHSLKTGEVIKKYTLEHDTIVGFSGDKDYSDFFFHSTSFTTPGIIYAVDLKKDLEAKVHHEMKVSGFDPKNYKTKQVFYPSKDGTLIPMFILTHKDAVLDGSMPALLYGYGGFNISIQATFSVTRLAFVQHLKGVVAIANIRGGGEYGEKWHNGGRFLNKQNGFDDFQYAAKYLIDNNYTCAEKLTIQGGSNGGLLVAACVNQRPDLFGAAIAEVGVMDMLRFHKFTVGYAWVSDYGCSDEKEHFENLIKYSPLHNVRPPSNNGQYPAVLLLTADHDDRVVPLHSLKLIATLQHTLGKLPQQTKPLMARIETKAGHGSGKPTSKIIGQSTDILAFIIRTLRLKFYK
ncbi:hypothetical protein HCN44_008403 [Aphidius gifuensis]|uniref:Prolyl endopeptidase n=1 Tax=Aphidius gifuensis TaxID=684658 RepID=A0A835CMC5_APHGI|nr:prolyl endopeptidase-like [Aphidius gifuensis]KAF7989729.1 hypothetical protein HCN44_008403 [Aphidius gifuensis]